MSIEKVREYFRKYGLEDRISEFPESSATVELAAAAVGCEPARIGKTLSFDLGERTVLVLTAGDAKIDNRKFKDCFGTKARMLPADKAESIIGHAVGGVCPFVINEGVDVYLDISIKRFETIFPAAGSGNSAIELNMAELEQHSRPLAWVDVCKGWE